ncbi:F-box domain, Leucine-rich repeat domain, L domain-like protein [Artemisia annua]|uniref:F-box domain, Leucine-rich repeat domain, L domain-like protein n=1 Tax=Artemisia annua TaxID=35608 RepID=A0A2U1P648_ARTAN|nr:F-box domain, Leucine-rich repeat domain, L domain-like protein [Artemisia annua]
MAPRYKLKCLPGDEEAEDRISELPEFIVDNILLRLDSSKDRVRVIALSKKWCALTASFPYLDFNFDEFRLGLYGTSYHDVAAYLFYKYVEHSVSRFCYQQILKNLHTFKLRTWFKDKKEVGIINKCLEFILEKGVKVLDIEIILSTNLQTNYRLPIGPSSSVSSLTSLKMSTKLLPFSLTDDDVAAFKYLKVLHFNLVSLDPHVIEHLTVSCRLLEELTVEYCSGLKKFHVYGCLQNLNKLRFSGNVGVEEIDIKAPNLRECHLFVKHVEGKGAPSMNLGSCKLLRTLHLARSPFLTSKGLSDFVSNFPFLENLSVCLDNRQASLETPVDFEQLKVTQSQPYELEHVELGLETIEDISVVDAVLLFCRPRSLSVVSNFYSIHIKEQGRVVKFIYDKLLQHEDEAHTRIQIEWSDAVASNSILTTFSDHQLRETVTLIKEEVVQEEENNNC